MFLDALTRVSNAQAFGAGAVSTDSIDLSLVTPRRKIGTGEPVGFGFVVTTSATVAATTLEVISATDGALTAGIVVEASVTIPLAQAVAGFAIFVAIPPGRPSNTTRFIGIRTTTAGGTISGTAWLTTQSMFSVQAENYRSGFTVQ
jgi:hypothetical protein